MTQVIANLVVRNEADAYLTRVLDRLSDQVDLICVTDDHSDDNTVELAASYDKVKVRVMAEPTFRVHEGRLRQASWEFLESNVTNPSDTMVLAIDADEELYCTGPSLHELAEWRNYNVFNVMFFHMWNENQFRTDGGWHPHGSTRYFRYQPGGHFQDRQLACGSEPTYVMQWVRSRQFMQRSGLVMKHLSYIRDEDKKKKFERYAELDGGAFHAGAHIKSIIDPPERVTLDNWRTIVPHG